MTEELKNIIAQHRRRYPLMQTADIYKLAYQRELGGGHLIADRSAAFDFLVKECEGLVPRMGDVAEDIGNGRVRIQLREALSKGISYETLFRIFENSADRARGSVDALINELASAGGMEEYIAAGCPSVHHSIIYRDSYRPAYRVADKVYMDFFDLFCRIDSLLSVKGSAVIAIDGMCAALKSTLASLIGGLYPSRVLHSDDYFLPLRKRTKSRLAEPGGNIDYERMKAEITEHVSGEVRLCRFDCRTGRLLAAQHIAAKPVTVVEGAYSLHPHFGDYSDISVLLTADPAEQEQRILLRNGEEMLERFRNEWIPMENTYLDALDIASKCDFKYKPELY